MSADLPSPAAVRVILDDLIEYSIPDLSVAFTRCRKELVGYGRVPSTAEIIERIPTHEAAEKQWRRPCYCPLDMMAEEECPHGFLSLVGREKMLSDIHKLSAEKDMTKAKKHDEPRRRRVTKKQL